jgi:hypothetical protein
MRLISTAIIDIGLCFAATGASADYFNPSQLAKVEAVKVAVEANVTGGCLDNPDVLKTEAELVLRRSGIKVVEDNSGHYLTIEVAGYAIIGGCSARYDVQTVDYEALTDGTAGVVLAAQMGGLRSGPKGGFPQQLREAVNEEVAELANETLKARQQ